jgi:hypothetical protein
MTLAPGEEWRFEMRLLVNLVGVGRLSLVFSLRVVVEDLGGFSEA